MPAADPPRVWTPFTVVRYAESMTESVHAAFGPFFEVEVHEADAPVGASWLTMAAALVDDDVLVDRVRRVRRALTASAPAEVEARVAASVTHLGLTARLVAPALGAAVTGASISLQPEHVWWRDELGGPFPLSVVLLGAADANPGAADAKPGAVEAKPGAVDAKPGAADANPGAAEAEYGAVDVDLGAVGELSEGFARRYPLSTRVLGGNVASAINSAARMIGMAVPDLADAALLHADRFLAHPDIEDGLLRSGPTFKRRSCCLIYRVSGDRTAVCGDCVLAR